ncbi:hypothetical protein DFH06DRAFT_1205271 [Mycena polygramma]|nr:hypothetical protein DFH06DRAFT_1205271 [Mycena polygramma]
MDDEEYTFVCALFDHAVFETATFVPETHRAFQLVIDLQKSHDAHCSCGTRIDSLYRAPFKWPAEGGTIIKNLGDGFAHEIRPFDFLAEHFPTPPDSSIVSIVCSTAMPPSSPGSSSSGRSKRSWDWSDAEAGSGSGHDRKRARTRSLSPPTSLDTSFSSENPSTKQPILSSLDSRLRLPLPEYDFGKTFTEPVFAWVDKSYSIFKLPDQFRYLLLRPPRFGTTAFLSTLEHYYDMHKAANFSKAFESAVATKDPSGEQNHNQHLFLSFQLSQFAILSDLENFVDSFNGHIVAALHCFVEEYASELQVTDPEQFLQSHDSDLLTHTLELVKRSPYTLFVTIDDYDAPSQTRFFAASNEVDEECLTQQDIESYIDSHFWGPLHQGSAAIAKLFVVGTFPLPTLNNLQLLNLSVEAALDLCCGFTEPEALRLAGSFLGHTPNITDLRRSCGQYIFSSPDMNGESVTPVLHPQRVLSRLSELGQDHTLPEYLHPFGRLSFILEHLSNESDISGAATIDGLIHLVASGALQIDTLMEAPLHPPPECPIVPWSVLYYLGALTRDRYSHSTFRLASSAVVSLIHERVDSILAARYDLKGQLLGAIEAWHSESDTKLLPDLLAEVLRDQTTRSLGSRHEPDLRGVVELVLGTTCCDAPQRLIGPLDLFSSSGVSRVGVRAVVADADTKGIQHWELRTLTLHGLWRATNANDDEPSVDDLRTLHEELVKDDEEHLLARPYSVWSPALNTMETVLVRSFVEIELAEPLFLAVGGTRVLTRRPNVSSCNVAGRSN